jgi:hypothetical protein
MDAISLYRNQRQLECVDDPEFLNYPVPECPAQTHRIPVTAFRDRAKFWITSVLKSVPASLRHGRYF